MATMYRFKIDKLIRDKLPAIMRESGMTVETRVLDDAAYLGSLKDKLVEEAAEVKAAASPEALREELGDVVEVLLALAAAQGWTFADIQKTAAAKKEKKGGFEERVFNTFVEVDEDHAFFAHYKNTAGAA